MSLEQALQHQVQMLCRGDSDSVSEETLRSIRLTILTRAAQILQLPFDPTELSADFSNRIALSPDTFKALDKAWSRITCTFADNRISNQEKHVRERLFFNAPYYADRTQLIRFINILSKRDATYCFFNARHEVSRSTSSRFSHLKTILLNRILAIDGFRGILPFQCRNYTNNLNDRLPVLDKTHLEATRAMYTGDFFVDGRHSGTVAAGLVLLALLKLYTDRVGRRMERATRHVLDKSVECVSNLIDDRDGSGDFVRKKDQKRCIRKIAKRYREKINDDALLDGIAFKKLVDYGKFALAKYLP